MNSFLSRSRSLLLFVIALAFATPAFALNIGDIVTKTGNGTPMFAGDGGQASSASINLPSSVALDTSGNIYVADQGNNRIRKVTVATGVITTVAGNGTATFGGDGGQATSASLNSPAGVALDSSGNIYIADVGNQRIRKVTVATGVISTVAGNGTAAFGGDGGQATSASINSPVGVALDSSGNIYIADYYNYRIRKVIVATGVITTVAGNGTGTFGGDGGQATSASINSPPGVALDASDNIYIADYLNQRVRKVTVTTGVITTVAGNGTGTFSGDGGQATSASLNYPAGIALDSSGNIYIADQFNHRVRKVTVATGIITTVAGNGSATFGGDGGQATSASLNNPAGITLDGSGNIYIADYSNSRIRLVYLNVIPITLSTPTVTNLAAGSASLVLQSSATGTGYFTLLPGSNAACGSGAQVMAGQNSLGSAAYRLGSLPLIANTPGYYTVRNLTASTQYTVCFTADDGSLLQPVAVSANLTTTAAASPTNAAWRQVGQAGFSTGAASYTSLAFAPDSTPHVAYRDNNGYGTVMKYSSGAWAPVGSNALYASSWTSLAFAPDGTPYVAYRHSITYKATVAKYSGDAWVTVGSGSFSAGQPEYISLAFAPDGTPYVAYRDSVNSNRATMMKYSGGTWVTVGSAAGFSAGEAPWISLAIGPDGTPYVAYMDVANSYKATVMKYSSGAWVTVGSAGFSAGKAAYTSLAIAPDGTPYVAYGDYANSGKATVMKYSGGAWVTVGSAGFSASEADYPSLAFVPDGTPYVAFHDYAKIYKATVMKYSGGTWVTVGSAGFSPDEVLYPSLAFAPDGTPFLAYQDYANSYKASVMKFGDAQAIPSVSNVSASAITATTAILGSNVNDGGASTTVTFQFGLNASYGSNASGGTVAVGSGATPASAAISGLTCYTTYHYRVVATNSVGTTNGSDQTFTTGTCVPNPTISVTLSGTGGGSINSNPAGIAFNGRGGSGMTTAFTGGTPITLYATQSTDSLFTGWSGGGCGGTGNCSIILNENIGISAIFNLNEQIKLNQTQATFASLQQAYNAVSGGDTLLLRAYTFIENLDFNRNVVVTLAGGLDSSYTSTVGATTLTGSVTITLGTVTIGDLVIQ